MLLLNALDANILGDSNFFEYTVKLQKIKKKAPIYHLSDLPVNIFLYLLWHLDSICNFFWNHLREHCISHGPLPLNTSVPIS